MHAASVRDARWFRLLVAATGVERSLRDSAADTLSDRDCDRDRDRDRGPFGADAGERWMLDREPLEDASLVLAPAPPLAATGPAAAVAAEAGEVRVPERSQSRARSEAWTLPLLDLEWAEAAWRGSAPSASVLPFASMDSSIVIANGGGSGGNEGRWIGCVSSTGTGARGGCTDATEETRENFGRAAPCGPGPGSACPCACAGTGAGATVDDRREVGVVEVEGGRGTSAGLTTARAGTAFA